MDIDENNDDLDVMLMRLSIGSFLFRVLMVMTFATSGVAHAQLRVVITEGQIAPTPIAIADFTGPDGEVTEIGRQMSAIISNDLESSGLSKREWNELMQVLGKEDLTN